MPEAFTTDDAYPALSQGPVTLAPVPAALHGIPATIPGSGQVQSNLIVTDGWLKAALGLTSSQAGVASLQRYLDDAGLVAQGPALTASLTANTAAVINVSDGAPFSSMQITITNTSGTIANLTNLALLLSGT